MRCCRISHFSSHFALSQHSLTPSQGLQLRAFYSGANISSVLDNDLFSSQNDHSSMSSIMMIAAFYSSSVMLHTLLWRKLPFERQSICPNRLVWHSDIYRKVRNLVP